MSPRPCPGVIALRVEGGVRVDITGGDTAANVAIREEIADRLRGLGADVTALDPLPRCERIEIRRLALAKIREQITPAVRAAKAKGVWG